MIVNVDEFLEGANEDLVQVLEDSIEGMVESHCDAWKDRYYRKSVDGISVDLYVNHDLSLEIERVEDELGRKIEIGEYEIINKYFNESVLNEFR